MNKKIQDARRLLKELESPRSGSCFEKAKRFFIIQESLKQVRKIQISA